MKGKFQAIAGSTLFLLLVCAGAAAQRQAGAHPAKTKTYRFDTVDYPGGFFTVPVDMNTADHTVVGLFKTSTSSNDQAFTFKGTTYKILQVPGAISSLLTGINRSDEMVGVYEDSADIAHGFLYSEGKFTTIDYPGATQTGAEAINDSGSIVGWYESNGIHGFLYDRGNYSSIDFPGAQGFTAAIGINSVGEIVGYWTDNSSMDHGFLLNGNTFTSLDFPQAQGTSAAGINDVGQITGNYTDRNFHGHGFIYTGGVWQTVDVTGAFDSQLSRIKNNGQIVGYFQDALGEAHGVLGH